MPSKADTNAIPIPSTLNNRHRQLENNNHQQHGQRRPESGHGCSESNPSLPYSLVRRPRHQQLSVVSRGEFQVGPQTSTPMVESTSIEMHSKVPERSRRRRKSYDTPQGENKEQRPVFFTDTPESQAEVPTEKTPLMSQMRTSPTRRAGPRDTGRRPSYKRSVNDAPQSIVPFYPNVFLSILIKSVATPNPNLIRTCSVNQDDGTTPLVQGASHHPENEFPDMDHNSNYFSLSFSSIEEESKKFSKLRLLKTLFLTSLIILTLVSPRDQPLQTYETVLMIDDKRSHIF